MTYDFSSNYYFLKDEQCPADKTSVFYLWKNWAEGKKTAHC